MRTSRWNPSNAIRSSDPLRPKHSWKSRATLRPSVVDEEKHKDRSRSALPALGSLYVPLEDQKLRDEEYEETYRVQVHHFMSLAGSVTTSPPSSPDFQPRPVTANLSSMQSTAMHQ
jgi:hypothetical protein